MKRMTVEEYRELAEAAAPPCVSIYLPTHRSGRETQGDPIVLKNLLKSAEDQLIQNGMRPTLARDLLEPARAIIDDSDYWMHSSEGLATFLAEGTFQNYRLPIAPEPEAMVNDRFHLRPLLPILADRTFHILALSMNDARVLECTRHSVEVVSLPKDVATSFGAAIGSKDHHVDRAIWRHGGGTSAQAQVSDAHGHGPDQDQEMREDIAFFMRQLDEGIIRAIGETTPLIVAAADSTWPDFVHTSKRKNVLPEAVSGNPEHIADSELRDKALEILSPRWDQELADLGERFGTASAHGIASDDVVEIVRAATEGRVDTLVVSPNASLWGEFDSDSNQARAGGDASEDLVEVAILQTLATNGEVVVASEDQVPGDREAAAIFRY